jgi:hypothetical protein
MQGMRWRSRLRDSATSWKAAVLVPDKVVGFFGWLNPPSRTVALGSTRPLTEMSTRNLAGCTDGQQARKADLTAICEPTV